MTHGDRLLELFRNANPVPDPDAFAAYVEGPVHLTILKEGTEPMQDTTTRPDPVTPARRHRWLTAAAAVVIAVLGIGTFVLVVDRANDGASTTAGVETAPVSVVVPGTEQWTDTGLDLSIDDTVLIEADGTVKPATYETSYGPDGAIDRPSAQVYNVEGLEEANHNGLIGRIGEAGAPFEVGSELLFEADTQGRLFLGMNDVDVENNVGVFTATITVNP